MRKAEKHVNHHRYSPLVRVFCVLHIDKIRVYTQMHSQGGFWQPDMHIYFVELMAYPTPVVGPMLRPSHPRDLCI